MLYIAAALVAGWTLTALAFAGLFRSLLRQQARERDLLINQVCHLARNPWQPPPSMEQLPDLDAELDLDLVPDIEQYPA